MILARQSLAFASPDATRFIPAPSPAVLGVLRRLENDFFLGLHNLSAETQHIDLPTRGPTPAILEPILPIGKVHHDRGTALGVDLEPYGYAWLRGTGL